MSAHSRLAARDTFALSSEREDAFTDTDVRDGEEGELDEGGMTTPPTLLTLLRGEWDITGGTESKLHEEKGQQKERSGVNVMRGSCATIVRLWVS